MTPEEATMLGKVIGAALACSFLGLLVVAAVVLLLRWLGGPRFLLPVARLSLGVLLGVAGIALFTIFALMFAI